jgi:hypothetical protein
MSVSSANAPAGGKTRYVETLTSGTSWTVPTGVEYVNATLIGAGGSGGTSTNGGNAEDIGHDGMGGQIITTSVTTTPGASISYTIGAGGTNPAATSTPGNAGGSTTFTGATTALGGNGGGSWSGAGAASRAGLIAFNGGSGGGRQSANSGAGGAGQIILEYWK